MCAARVTLLNHLEKAQKTDLQFATSEFICPVGSLSSSLMRPSPVPISEALTSVQQAILGSTFTFKTFLAFSAAGDDSFSTTMHASPPGRHQHKKVKARWEDPLWWPQHPA